MGGSISNNKPEIFSYSGMDWGKIAHAPFDVDIFRQLVEEAVNRSDCDVKVASKHAPEAGKINIFLRHDIDFARDVTRLATLLEIERSLGVGSAVYIRMDGQDYDPADLKEIIAGFGEREFEVGLHTTCYLWDSYIERFREETRLFRDTFGFQPLSFTIHGMGKHRLVQRLQFRKEIEHVMEDMGYRFYDDFPKYLKYKYVIQDCHGGPLYEQRFLLKDFTSIPSFFTPGLSYLVLTHPGYWE